MRFNVIVSLLAIILVTSGLLGFVGFNIPEVKALPPTILVGGNVRSDATYGFWIGSRGNRTNTVGSNVQYTVNITDVTELWSFDFTLAWGMTVLELNTRTVRIPKATYPDGILNNPQFQISQTSLSDANRTALYRLAWTQSGIATPFTGSGCAVYLTFRVLSPGGECDIYFVDSKLSFKNGTAITHSRTDGYFYQPTKKRVPTASFTTSPATKISNKTSVTFNGAASSDPDAGGGIASYIWNFGQDKPIIPVVESPHPYPVSAKLNYTLKYTNAIRMRIYFTNITLESGDAVRIRDKNNALCQSFLVSYGPPGIWSNWVKGDTININLTGDGDVGVGWGFLANHYNFFLQVVTSSTSYTYTILLSDYEGSPYGPYAFTASLSVVDNEASQSRTVSSAIQVVHPRPVARFTFSPNVTHYHPAVNWAYIFGSETVSFDASGSYDPDPGGGIAWYNWEFGDGTSHNKTIPTTSYSFTKHGGVMTIGLTIKDTTDGLRSYWSYSIRVYNMTECAKAYGSNGGTPPWIPPSPNWNDFYEIIPDNIIDADDLYVVGRSYY